MAKLSKTQQIQITGTRMETCNCRALILFCLLLSFIQTFTSLDTISSSQSINGNDTLVSAAGTFEAGFFNIGNSTNQYFCVWFHGISPRAVVWVANRDSPIKNSTGVFKVIGGSPTIVDGSGTTIWFSNASRIAESSVIQLLDSGNLVVKDGTNEENILWESFDFPGDTLLPGMKIKSNLITGEYTSLTCWKSTEDPGSCRYSYHLDPHGFPQLVTTKGSKFLYRAGPWTGDHFTGITYKSLHKLFNYSFVLTEREVSYGHEPVNGTTITRYMLNPTGFVSRLIWSESTGTWDVYFTGPNPYGDECEIYAKCGSNSNCYIENSPICQCLKGFVPKFPAKWNSGNWTDGCIRRTNLSCNTGDTFLKYTGMKLPDTTFSWFDQTMNLEKCQNLCLGNCSCTAYANSDVRDGGSGCVLWFGDIVDLRNIDGGQDIYMRLAASELDETSNNSHFNEKLKAGLIGAGAFIIVIAILALARCVRRKKPKKPDISKPIYARGEEEEDVILPIFDLSIIVDATNQFSPSNKLGGGGFGPVYKGALANGREIAVKRLARNSAQGPEEFRNEVVLIANLQHRNLVKLVGCCIEQDERLLIYEFMPNQSLDYFIFDHTRSNLLDWTKRFHIIEGIARGLVYLHQDSMLRIIHRDLKPSNILLDSDMNPKISDFGLARAFEGDQVEVNTKRVMGTYGYMPPEYVVHGSFSIKTDVFSFGVIILEIVSGKKIRDFCDQHHHLNLFEYAWRLWCERRPLELVDESLGHSITTAEVLRCIHVGLLCVQERPEDRPKMSSVVLMLTGAKPLPKPMQPAFYSDESGKCGQGSSSTNEMSMSMLEAR